MKRFNLFDESLLDVDEDEPDGYRAPYAKVQHRVGASLLGGTVVLLRQGEAVCPYHYEQIEEEWLFVLAGAPTVRTPEGERVYETGDVVCFPRGPAGAHKISNAGEEPARILIVSEHAEVAAAIYEDSDKIGIFGPELRMLFRRRDARDYWDGERPEEGPGLTG
jgi:uncharacterized cupin superfamily protein